jgi:hypothetical protein
MVDKDASERIGPLPKHSRDSGVPLYISLTVWKGPYQYPAARDCMLWSLSKMPPAILAIAAQCLIGAYQIKQTRRRTGK